MMNDQAPKTFYKLLIVGILGMAVFVASINATNLDLFNNVSLTVNLVFFKTTISYIFLFLIVFMSVLFILRGAVVVNRGSITTILLLYMFSHAIAILISLARGAEFTVWNTSDILYPLFAIIFLDKQWRSETFIPYFMKAIAIAIYIAIFIDVISLIIGRSSLHLDLLDISLLFLAFSLSHRNWIKPVLLVSLLAITSGFNLTWLFTGIFLLLLNIKHSFHASIIAKMAFVLSVIGVVLAIVYYSPSFAPLKARLPGTERFSVNELLRATGRTKLWEKYIGGYEADPLELLFGHGEAYVYTLGGVTLVHLHNIFFDEFYKRGVIGIVLFFFLIYISLRAQAPFYLKSFFVASLIMGLSSLVAFKGIPGVVFWMTVGMLNNASSLGVGSGDLN